MRSSLSHCYLVRQAVFPSDISCVLFHQVLSSYRVFGTMVEEGKSVMDDAE